MNNGTDREGTVLHATKKFLKRILTISTIYAIGYFKISVAWLIAPVLFSLLCDEWKKGNYKKRELAKLAAITSEKDILSNIADLPAWVYFPDIERAEWLNKICFQLWPNVNAYAREIIKSHIEPQIEEILKTYGLTGFRFEKMRLGTIPPRIGGIKVYDKHTSRTEIMLDIDLIYAGDCDISFYLKGFSGGIKDFQIHGMMRVIMKPLIPVSPLIGGLQIFFLNKPSVDFNLVGAVDLLDIPGLSDLLRGAIVDQIANMMVLPNKFPVVLSDVVPAIDVKMPEPEAVLRVHIVQAKHLMKKDIGVLGKGKSDPYVVVNLGAQSCRSKAINNTINPKWDYWCEVMVTLSRTEELKLEVWDWDPGFPGTQNDDFLGRASVKLMEIIEHGEVDSWLSLEEVKHGMIHVRAVWYELTADASDLDAILKELAEIKAPSLSSALLNVYVDSVQNLEDAKNNVRPDPILHVTVGHQTKYTAVKFRTNDPVYEQGFSFLVGNPERDYMNMKIIDQKTGCELGSLSYSLDALIKKSNLKQELEPISFQKSRTHAKILFSAQLKVLKRSPKKLILHSAENHSFEDLNKLESLHSDGSLNFDEESREPMPIAAADDTGGTTNMEDTSSLLSSSSHTNSVVEENSSVLQKSAKFEIGSIQLSINYSEKAQNLFVVVHRIDDLLLKECSDSPEIYVKLYLLPKSKETKRKTRVVKGAANVDFEEAFEYVLSSNEMQYKKLRVMVISQKMSFVSRNSTVGEVIINMHETGTNVSKKWYPISHYEE